MQQPSFHKCTARIARGAFSRGWSTSVVSPCTHVESATTWVSPPSWAVGSEEPRCPSSRRSASTIARSSPVFAVREHAPK
eukprot:9352646-Pyramimonas_sp.AAC.1